MRWIPLTLLAGCPYIWNAPVDPVAPEADADADTDTDSDTDTDTDTDTNDTAQPGFRVDDVFFGLGLHRLVAGPVLQPRPDRVVLDGLPDGPVTFERPELSFAGNSNAQVRFAADPCTSLQTRLTVTTSGVAGSQTASVSIDLPSIAHDTTTSTPQVDPPFTACGTAIPGDADCLGFAGIGPHVITVVARPDGRITLQQGATTVVNATGSLRRTVDLDPHEAYQVCVQGDAIDWSLLVTR